jgi:histidyl-tRNA synthetase
LQKPRGTKDLFGEELAAIRRGLQVIGELAERYGYREVETPMFEHLELFTAKSGMNVVSQIYAFKDKGGREIALRPEITPSTVRLYTEKFRSDPKPVKLWYSGSCFRYEEPQAMRWRQFTQAGVEVIGSSRSDADAEVVALVNEVMDKIGLANFKLKLGHVRLLREVLSQAGVKGPGQDPILRAMDSGEEQRLSEELARAKVPKDFEKLLHELASLSGGVEVLKKAREMLEKVPAALHALDNLQEIINLLGRMGVEGFEVDLGIARGLDYYTGFVFEVYSDGVQVAGGGRYDELVQLLGGEQTPAVGVGFGVDRIANALLSARKLKQKQPLDCVVVSTEEKMIPDALGIASELRRAGLKVQVDLMGRKLRKALEYADSLNAEKVVIVGAKEHSGGQVVLRDMKTGEQETVHKAKIAEKLKPVA